MPKALSAKQKRKDPFNRDPHHQPVARLPRTADSGVRTPVKLHGLLYRTKLRLGWIEVVRRCKAAADANLIPNLGESGQVALNGIHTRLTSGTYYPSFREMVFLNNVDLKRPCAAPACPNLGYYSFKCWAYCREHEAAYWHQRQVWDRFRQPEAKSALVTEIQAESDQWLKAIENLRKTRLGRKR